MKIRLNKYLTLCGLGSRRSVEPLITSGKIRINGRVEKNLGVYVETETDQVEYDGRQIHLHRQFHYIILNKPKGYITTTRDEKGRPTVMDILPEKYMRTGVFPVGRLDRDSEGLLLLTNDGDLAHRLTHPGYKVTKEYIIELDRPLSREHKSKAEKGVFIHQLKIKTRPARIRVLTHTPHIVQVFISEGKKRQLRYTFSNMGYHVQKLTRVSYGPLQLKGLHRGSHRSLRGKEIKALLSMAGKPGIKA